MGSNNPTNNIGSVLKASLDFVSITRSDDDYLAEFKIDFIDNEGSIADVSWSRPVTYTTSISDAGISGDSSQAHWIGSSSDYGIITATVDSQFLKLGAVYNFDDLSASISDNTISDICIMNDINLTSRLGISRSVNINGNGHTLNGLNQKSGFRIFLGDVVFNDIGFINCYSGSDDGNDIDGGAIHAFSTADSLTVNNCFFKDNNAWSVSSAIATISCPLMVNDCLFEHNGYAHTYYGAVIWVTGGSNGTVKNSAFINNARHNNGDEVFTDGQSTLNCYNNWWGQNTGYTWDSDPLNPMSEFVSLTSVNDETVVLYKTNFVKSSNGEVVSVSWCRPISGFDYVGGTTDKGYWQYNRIPDSSNPAFYYVDNEKLSVYTNTDTYDYSFTTLQNIVDAFSGKIICLNHNFEYDSVKDSALTEGVVITSSISIGGNHYTIDAGNKTRVFKITGSNVNLTNLKLIHGMADYGGAVYIDGMNVNLDSIEFKDNTAVNGGGLYVNDGNVNITGGSVESNHAVNGGGLYVNYADLNLINVSIKDCSAYDDGGAIYINNGKVSISALMDLYNNTAVNNGGAFYVAGGTLKSSNNQANIHNNTAGNDGGAFYISGGIVTLNDNSIHNNTAVNNGGAFYISGGIVSLNDTCIYNNTAGNVGGAFYINGGDLLMGNSEIYDNNAVNGSGFYVNGGSAALTNCIVHSHTAFDGAGFYVNQDGELSISGGSINDNSAVDGAGLYVIGTLTVDNVHIYNNTANNYGGGLYLAGNADKILSGTTNIEYNTAIKGSAIFIAESVGSVSLSDIKLLNNLANITNISLNAAQDRRKYWVNATFNGGDNFLNALYVNISKNNYNNQLHLSSVTYYGCDGVITTTANIHSDIFANNELDSTYPTVHPSPNQNFTIGLYDGETLIKEYNVVSDNYGCVNNILFDELMSAEKNYTLKISHIKDNYYNNYINSMNVSLNKIDSVINLTTPVVAYSEDVIVTLLNSSSAGGSMSLSYTTDAGSTTFTEWAEVINGTAVFNLTNRKIPANIELYAISLFYSGDDNYNTASGSFLLNVTKATPDFSINAPFISFGENATVYINLPDDATGNVVINTTTGNYYAEILDITVIRNATLINPKSGNYMVNATYSGDNNYLPGSVNCTLFVDRPKSSLNISVEDIFVGSDVLINFTVNSLITGELYSDAYGILRVYVGGESYQLNVTNGRANLTVSDLPISTYVVVAIYDGDENYVGTDTSTTFNVDGYQTNLTINVSESVSYVEDNVIVTVNVTSSLPVNDEPVYLYLNGKLYNILLTTEGIVVFNVTGLDAGAYNVSAVFPATATFGSAINNTLITVLKHDILWELDSITGDDNVTLVVSLPADATGSINISWTENTHTYNITSGGVQYITLPHLEVDTYNFTVFYSGDRKYNNKTDSIIVDVAKKSNYPMNITTGSIVRGENITIYVNLPDEFANNGYVNLTVNGVLHDNLPLIAGKSIFIVNDTEDLDNITVTAIYSGFDNYDTKKVTNVFLIEATDDYIVNITVDEPVYVGEDVTVNITAPVQFNNVNFTININGVEDNVLIINGKGNYTIHDVSLGHYDVSLTSVDNKYYIAQTFTNSFDAIKRNTELNITDIPSSIFVNGDFKITVNSNLNGDANIMLYVDGVKKTVQLWNNNIFTVPGLSSGDHIITVSFEGNDYYNSNSNSTHVNVLKLPSDVSVSASDIDVGQNLVVDVNASGNGSATIKIYDSMNVLFGEYILSINNGKGKIIVPDKITQEGQYTINITYNGDNIYNTSTNHTVFTVNLATDYDFKVITTDAFVGGDVTVDVSLPVNANKNVTLTLPNGTNITEKLNNGSARFIIPGMAYGDYSVNLTYMGDNNYARDTKIARFSVYKNTPLMDLMFNITDEGNVSIVNSIVQGEDTILIITLPEDAQGYVNITGNNIDFKNQILNNGQVNITLKDLDAGYYNIVVSYGGDDKYNAASASIVLVVASSKTSIVISPIATQFVGSDVKVNVKTDASGNVTLYVNGIKFENVVISDGWANFTIPEISADSNPVNIFVVYESNGQYASAFNSTQFNVEKLNTTISALSDGVNVTVKVLAGVGGSVVVTFNGVNYTAVINDEGVAVVSLPKVPGAYKLPVYYIGDAKYNANSTSVDVSIPWGDDYVLNATVDETGKVVINIDSKAKGNVTVSLDSNSPVNINLTDGDGVKVGEYQLPVDLSVGSHIVTVSYAGDNDLGAKSYSLIYNAPKKDSMIKEVTVDAVMNGTNSVVNVTMNGVESGSVIVELNGINYTVAINEGRALFEILLNANASGKVYYMGNDVFNAAAPFEFTAVVNSKADSIIVINDPVLNIGESATITANVNGVVNNDVVVMINGIETSTIAGVEAITYNVVAVFAGNSTHKANSTNKTFVVTKKESLIKNVVVDAVVNGTKSVVNVTMNGVESGSVIVEINGMNYTVAIKDGRALFEILLDATTSGKVYYMGNDVFNAAAPVEFTAVVNSKADSVVVITTDSLTIGESATISATVNGASSDKIKYIINGVETDTIDLVVGGTYSVVAVFEGNSTHKAANATKTFTVNKLDAPIKVTVDDEYMVNETIDIGVDAIGGTIITINGVAFDASKTSYAAGSYTIVAIFEGNSTHKANSTTKTFTVNKLDSPVSIDVGESYNVTDAISIGIVAPEGAFKTINGVSYVAKTSYAAGTYTVVVSVVENATHKANSTSKTFIVYDLDAIVPVITIDGPSDDVVYGSPVTVNVHVTTADNLPFSGLVYLGYYETEFGVVISAGEGSYTFDSNTQFLSKGKHEFVAVFEGDNKYAEARSNNITVNVVAKELSEDDISVFFENNAPDGVNVTVYGPDGFYNVTVDGETVQVNVEDGEGSVEISTLSLGNKTATIAIDDDNYRLTPFTCEFSYFKDSEFKAELVKDSIKYGENATVKITIASDAAGNITVYDNDELYYEFSVAEARNGIEIPLLSAGEHEIKVVYSGDGQYSESADYDWINVEKIAPAIEVNVTANPKVGDKVTLNVSVDVNEDGNLTIIVDGKEIFKGETDLGGLASVDVDNLDAGEHTYIVTFKGTENYLSNQVVGTFTVDKAPTAVTISVDDDLGVMGGAIVNITVSNNVAGLISIDNDGVVSVVEITDGSYSFEIYDLQAGDYYIDVTFLGNDNYLKSNASFKVNIPKAVANPIVVVDSEIKGGQDAVVNVTMDNDAASGKVTVYVDGVENITVDLDEDYANVSVIIKGLGKGNHTIGVKYDGNDNYNASLIVNNSVSVNGNAVDPETAFINPDSTNPETFGIDLPGDATGIFTVRVDGEDYANVSLVDGKANVTVSGLSDGSHNVELVYSGDGNYSGMGKTQTLVVVNGNSTPAGPVSPGSPDTVFSIPNGTVNPPVFSINLPSDAGGNFTVSIGGKEYNATVVGGKANVTVEGLGAGSYPIVVSYSGDSKYGGLFKTSTVKLDSAPAPAPVAVKKATVITPAKKMYTFKKSKRSKTKTFKVTLKVKGGSALAGKVVKIKLTNAKKIKLSKKAKKAISKAKKAVKKAKGKKSKAKAKKKLAKAMKPQTMLKQLKKGTYVVKTNSKGVAKLTLAKKSFTFKKSSGKLTAKFAGDSSYLGSSKTVNVVIK